MLHNCLGRTGTDCKIVPPNLAVTVRLHLVLLFLPVTSTVLRFFEKCSKKALK